MAQPWTPQEIDEFARMWAENASLKEIATAIGRTFEATQLRRILLFRAGDTRFAPRSWNGTWRGDRASKRMLKVFEDVGADATLAELSAASGRHPQTVSKWLRPAGITFQREKHGVERKVAMLRNDGLSDDAIASLMGITRLSVQQIASRARALGIEVPYRINRQRRRDCAGDPA